MKTTTNKDMLNAIRNQASEEYQERMPMITAEVGTTDALRKLNEYPTIKNEFIDTLINKVVKTDFFSKVYENPLKMLKKGSMPYGASIEELFVRYADAKGFLSSDNDGKDSANELVGIKKATIDKLYITRNFAYVFKVSISDAQLKSAFTSANGLSELVNQLVGSLTSGAEFKEYDDMIKMIIAAAEGERLVDKNDGTLQGQKITAGQGVVNLMHKETITDARSIAKMVRTLAGRMKFMNTKYNMAGVPTFCSPEDLVLLVEPETLAELDVDLLAEAFNVSKAEVGVRTIIVDKLPKQMATGSISSHSKSGANVKAILMDKQFIQAIDTVHESRQFENGRNLTTNIFLHKQGILANCYFANCVALVK